MIQETESYVKVAREQKDILQKRFWLQNENELDC